jgi:hypothetical protein
MENDDVILSGPAEVGLNLIDDAPASRIGIQERFDVKSFAIACVQQVVMHVLHIVEAAIESANVTWITVDANK